MKNFPFDECPRYLTCSVNRCPLDPGQSFKKGIPGDKERYCRMEKQVRFRIGSKYPELLPRLGLTRREVAGAAFWSNCSPSQKSESQRRLDEHRESALAKAKAIRGKSKMSTFGTRGDAK